MDDKQKALILEYGKLAAKDLQSNSNELGTTKDKRRKRMEEILSLLNMSVSQVVNALRELMPAGHH